MTQFFKSKIALKVKGRNVNRFIKKLATRKIDILSLKYINRNEVEIIIYKKDYETVLKIKSIYEILEEEVFGYIKIKKVMKINIHLIIALSIGYLIFFALTHIIFYIEVVHSNKEVRSLIEGELYNNGIKKYTFKKSYDDLKKIKQKIINAHPDEIEWIEIETKGTKYIVRVEEREIIKNTDTNVPRSIIAKKDGIIKKVISSKGEIVRDKNDYVKKGDTIISGDVMLYEKIMGKVKSEGKVYAEVWYVITMEYPFMYHEEKETGKSKEVYTIKILNKDIEFTTKKYKTKKIKEDIILKQPLLPIKLVKQYQKETKVINQVLTFEEAVIKAQDLSVKKIEANLKEEEYIIRHKCLKNTIKNNKVEVEMFFAVYEDITNYKDIPKEKPKSNKKP